MIELRRCPFCGFKAAGALLDDRPVKLSEPLSGAIVAVCPKCLAKGPVHVDQTTEEAISAWNRREPDWERKWEGLVETTGARIAQDEALKKGAK